MIIIKMLYFICLLNTAAITEVKRDIKTRSLDVIWKLIIKGMVFHKGSDMDCIIKKTI